MKNIIKIIIVLLICMFYTVNIVDAKGFRIKYHGGGHFISKGIRVGVKEFYKKNNIGKYDIDYHKFCVGYQDPNKYIIDFDTIFPYSIEEIENLKIDINNTYVNRYDRGSVNYYNSKVNRLNRMISANNNVLIEKGIKVTEYCKPYNCDKKYSGSIYNRILNTCDKDGEHYQYNNCNIGECELNGICYKKPNNAKCAINDKYNAWKCKEGFFEKNNKCVKDPNFVSKKDNKNKQNNVIVDNNKEKGSWYDWFLKHYIITIIGILFFIGFFFGEENNNSGS